MLPEWGEVGRIWGKSGKRWLKKEKSGVKWGIKQANLGKGALKMFLGTHEPRLDDKGRLILPAKFREASRVQRCGDGAATPRTEWRVIQIKIGKQGRRGSERSADSWVLVSTATGIFRHHGVFAVRPKLQEQEPFKLLHDAREEEEV